MKKQRNWLGWGWLCFVILSLLLLLFLANLAFNLSMPNIGSILGVLSFIWFCIALFFTPKIMRKTWLRILPLQTVNAKLIDKHSTRNVVYANGTRHIVRDYFVFELPDGTRKAFDVTGNNSFHTALLNEDGILKFKEHKNALYFISFERQQ